MKRVLLSVAYKKFNSCPFLEFCTKKNPFLARLRNNSIIIGQSILSSLPFCHSHLYAINLREHPINVIMEPIPVFMAQPGLYFWTICRPGKCGKSWLYRPAYKQMKSGQHGLFLAAVLRLLIWPMAWMSEVVISFLMPTFRPQRDSNGHLTERTLLCLQWSMREFQKHVDVFLQESSIDDVSNHSPSRSDSGFFIMFFSRCLVL